MSSRLRIPLELLAVAVAYVAAADLAVHAAVIDGGAAPLWPSAGIAMAAVLLRGRCVLPAVAVGAAITELRIGVSPPAALAMACGATAEVALGTHVFRRAGGSLRLGRVRDVVALGALGAFGACLVSGVVGATALALDGRIAWADALAVGRVWWLGDAAGVLVVTPLVLVLARRPRLAPGVSGVLLGAALVGVGAAVLGSAGGEPYVLFPLVAWIGLRHGPAGVSTANLAVAVIAVAFAARGAGPFADETVAASVLAAQTFLLTMAGTSLVLAAIAAELRASRREEQLLAAEQAALRRVAEAVAAEVPIRHLLWFVAREITRLFAVDHAAVVRFRDDEASVEVCGRCTAPGGDAGPAADDIVVLQPGSAVDAVRRSGRAARFDERGQAAPSLPPFVQRVAVPVRVDGGTWGAVLVASTRTTDLPADLEARLQGFADLCGTALTNAMAHARLVEQARTDPLTGLVNHAAFHERLAGEVALARRHGSPLSVLVLDLDGFKQVNDTAGHLEGDAVLRGAADCLRRAIRAGDLAARLGGDELAVLLPRTDLHGALRTAGRIRDELAAAALGPVGNQTASVGVCDLRPGASAEQLLRGADVALYRSKALGGDGAVAYDPELLEEADAQGGRAGTLVGLRAMARAIDARDPTTIRHSERVAVLAEQVALRCGWRRGDALRLRQAALVHDVGKLGVSDAVLLKPGPLTPEERRDVERHAVLSAEIAAGVLDAEQVAWVRGHHERFDGGGYPDGLAGEALPEGAALLAVADAWDAMTVARHYGEPLTEVAALEELGRQRGRHFAPAAVDAALAVLLSAEHAAPVPA